MPSFCPFSSHPPGSLRYLLMAELFRQSSRSSAYVVGGSHIGIIHFFGILIYVQIKQYIGPYTFLVSLPFCVAAFLYIYKVIPETKNRTFMEIYNLLSEEKKAAFDVEPDE
nr:PREDICTED: solute carrier family 2, facilitated glucose transporter member 5-like [Anolis carolinensis]|eukprot:XP_016854726.1 PREDICTED: solute carrier family 2, facilitated glucose transporter member 5-like [Anolis carolinensis]